MMDVASVNPWALFESIPEMVVVVDNDGIVLYSNAHSLDILGWSPAELVGQPIEVLIPDRLHTCASVAPSYVRPRPEGSSHGEWLAVDRIAPHRP